jgi:hypothetical protein
MGFYFFFTQRKKERQEAKYETTLLTWRATIQKYYYLNA